jgi:hypothetical protein
MFIAEWKVLAKLLYIPNFLKKIFQKVIDIFRNSL